MSDVGEIKKLSFKAIVCVIAIALCACFAFIAMIPQKAHADEQNSVRVWVSCDGSNPRSFAVKTARELNDCMDDMTSTRNNPYEVHDVRVDLFTDFNTDETIIFDGYSLSEGGNHYTLNLHGHMINRGLANTGFEGVGDGGVIRVEDGAYLTINGGSDIENTYQHLGTKTATRGNAAFWKYDGKGSDILTGGLITGGATAACNFGGGITVFGAGNLTVNSATIAGNVADTFRGLFFWEEEGGNGAGIYSKGTVTLSSAKILYNYAKVSAGGIYIDANQSESFRKDYTNLNINEGTIIEGNTALKDGGAAKIDCTPKSTYTGSLNVRMGGATISSNYAGENGAGIDFKGRIAGWTSTGVNKFEKNCAGQKGGAICFESQKSSTSVLNGSEFKTTGDLEFSENTANCGGAIYYALPVVSKYLDGLGLVYFRNNTATCNGGAIASEGDTGNGLLVCNATFEGNSAHTGGAIWFRNALNLIDTIVKNNTATNKGGGIYCDNDKNDRLELNGVIKINENSIVQMQGETKVFKTKSNLSIRGEQKIVGACNGNGPLSNSRIGITIENFSNGIRLIANDTNLSENIGKYWSQVFLSDDDTCTIENRYENNNYGNLYLNKA